MTLGLAVADEDGIYLAIESQGLPQILELASKIITLQDDPKVVVLAAGGLPHWVDVRTNYNRQTSVKKAAVEVQRLLNIHTRNDNDVHGLVCGYSDDEPKCYRLDKFQGDGVASIREESLDEIQAVGSPEHAPVAINDADSSIAKGIARLTAITEAIANQIPGRNLLPPVENSTINP